MTVASLLVFAGSDANAAVSHEFLAVTSAHISKGAPFGCGTASPSCVAGPVSGVNALSTDSGHLWVAERLEAGKDVSRSRVDKFDDSTGEFQVPQLDEEGGVEHLETAVAVGHPGGEEEVYVGAGQEGKRVVAVFGPSGKLQHAWTGANTPSKSFSSISGVAVSADLQTQNDVYVATRGSTPDENVVDVFAGEAGGSEPAEVLGRIRGPETPCEAGQPACVNPLTQETCEEEELGCVSLFTEPRGVTVSPVSGDVLVSDGDPEACSSASPECQVDVFKPTAIPGSYEFLFPIKGAPGEPVKRIGPMAVDGNGDIYVVEKDANIVEQFDAEGKFLTRITGTPEGPFHSLQSVAADQASGDIYVGDFDQVQQTGVVDAFGPSEIVPDVTTTAPSAVHVELGPSGEGQIEATLNGTVDPLGEGEATCQFAWGSTTAFGQLAPCATSVPNGSGPVPVKATLKEGLAPDTSYLFRLQATNKNGTNPGEASDDEVLTTPGPGIHSESVSEVASTSATLKAAIDPNGASTSYFFQYGTSAAYEAQVPAVPGALGAGSGPPDVQVPPQHIQNLAPETTYHYRIVAVSQLEVSGKVQAVPFPGPDQTFTTQRALGGAELPDGRRWELVSPADKHGAVLLSVGVGGVIEASSSGDAVTYLATIPTEEGVKGYLYGGVQVLSEHSPTGWSSKDISLAHATPLGLPGGSGQEYRFFSDDLSRALVEPLGEFNSLSPEAFPPDSERTPYVRHNSTCAVVPSGCYQPLLTGAPGFADVPEGTKFGGSGGLFSEAKFVGATGDLAHAILSSKVPLTSTPTGSKQELYEATPANPPATQLQLISLLPPNEKGEELPAEGAQLGFDGTIARNAIYADGSRGVWSEENGHLYMRDTAKGQSVQLDVAEASCSECGEGSAGSRFQLASADATRVLFTDPQRLTAGAGKTPGKADLYECEVTEVAGKLQCQLTDLTPAPGPGKAADVQGAVVGASEDASWIYFVANGVLGDAGAHGAGAGDCRLNGEKGEGQCNLYVIHEGATHWIATLAGADYPDWAGRGGSDLSKLTARVSPDGHHLAFMSQLALTGYDNHDAVSGQPDEEVFEYDAEAGSIACASCDPSGARPRGVEYEKLGGLVAGSGVWARDTWLAANIPGWTPYELNHALYQPRYLSNSGRLFFNSNDALVAQDINKNQDAYEYEPLGVGDCTSQSASFDAAKGGCVALISSGRAAGESAFIDASENGDDVFFLTGERLVPQDVDTTLDLYDAHVCSSEVPCPEEAVPPPACVTTDSCRSAPSAQPQIFGSPASATFSGEGNLVPPAPKPTVKKPARAQLLAKALKSCRSKYKHAKKRRVSCEAQARKRYGLKQAAKKSERKAKKK